MYITAQTIISAVALASAVGAIVGGLFAIYRWYQRQNKQDEDIKAMKEEMCLLTYGVLACLKGLKEQGCNGPVSFLALMAWQKQPITWYMMFACMIAAFIVALVSMDGWERIKEILERTGYKDKK